MKYKVILLIALIAFSVTLAAIVGQRLSAEAMAVVVGVLAGVAASIPTSLIVVWIAARPTTADRSTAAPAPEAESPNPPRVIVVQPQSTAQPMPGQPYGYTYPPLAQHSFALPYPAAPFAPLPSQRTFTVIGGEALEGAEHMSWAQGGVSLSL